MRKIVIANDYLTGGGVENVLDNIVKKLIQEKYEVFLMIPNCNQKDIMQGICQQEDLLHPSGVPFH